MIPLPLINTFGSPLEPPTSNESPKKPKLETTDSAANSFCSFMFEAVTLPRESTKNPEEDISPLADMITFGTSCVPPTDNLVLKETKCCNYTIGV